MPAPLAAFQGCCGGRIMYSFTNNETKQSIEKALAGIGPGMGVVAMTTQYQTTAEKALEEFGFARVGQFKNSLYGPSGNIITTWFWVGSWGIPVPNRNNPIPVVPAVPRPSFFKRLIRRLF